MQQNKEKIISRKSVKSNFTTIGLLLILYVFLVMFIPYAIHYYFIETNSSILDDNILYYGIYFIILFFGSIFPFFLMRKHFKVTFRRIMRKANVGFVDIFVQTIVFFTICIALTYVSNMLINYFGLESKLISGIGLSYDDVNIKNILYVFMLIFVSPLLEEYAFRGVLLYSLSKYGKNFALYATSIIFALAHNNIAEIIPAFAMGVALGKTSLRYKSIQPTIIIHILFNLFIYLLCILPEIVAQYLAYGLLVICVIAIVLIINGRYEKVKIMHSKTSKVAAEIFYSRPTIIITMILMIAYTCLFNLVK